VNIEIIMKNLEVLSNDKEKIKQLKGKDYDLEYLELCINKLKERIKDYEQSK
tara:strand:- start:142 stop:297 length:156 start_codon:yes stop_codon:yes gene_type:complete